MATAGSWVVEGGDRSYYPSELMLRVGSTGTPATPLPSPQKVNGGHEGQALQCDSHSKFPGVLLCFSFSALWLSGCHNPCGLEAEKGVEAGEGGGLFPQPIGAVGGGHVTRCLQAEQRVPRSIFLSCETGAPLPLLATERSAGWGWVWGGVWDGPVSIVGPAND